MSDSKDRIRVFIGSGEASVIERKVLMYSIRKNTPEPVDIYVFNGTHNALEKNDEPPVLLNMSLRVKYKNVTEFSNYRFMIPEICGYKGRAIFIDSDTISVQNISNLFRSDMKDHDLLAKPNAYNHSGESKWGLSVMLMDCSKCRFDLEQYWNEIEAGKYESSDYHQMSPKFLKYHPFSIGPLDSTWNDFDNYTKDTKIIHYTNLYTQPWKAPGHKHGELWFTYFNEARKAGAITDQDIDKAILRSYVRPDLKTATNSGVKFHLRELLKAMKSAVRS